MINDDIVNGISSFAMVLGMDNLDMALVLMLRVMRRS